MSSDLRRPKPTSVGEGRSFGEGGLVLHPRASDGFSRRPPVAESARRGLCPATMIHILFELIRAILGLISVILIVYVVISWLYAFDIIDRRNQFVRSVWEFCSRLTDPILRPLRRLIPPIAGVDLSVLVLLLVIWLLQNEVSYWIEGMLLGTRGFL
jgi:YggT family protein